MASSAFIVSHCAGAGRGASRQRLKKSVLRPVQHAQALQCFRPQGGGWRAVRHMRELEILFLRDAGELDHLPYHAVNIGKPADQTEAAAHGEGQGGDHPFRDWRQVLRFRRVAEEKLPE